MIQHFVLFQYRRLAHIALICSLTPQAVAAGPPFPEPPVSKDYLSFQNDWEVLLPYAGRPQGDVIHSAHVVVDTKGASLLLSITNVSTRTILFPPTGPHDLTNVLVLDSSQHQMKLTPEGVEGYVRALTAGGSVACRTIPPGYSWGSVVRLNDFYDLSKPGRFSAMASRQYRVTRKMQFERPAEVVSNTVEFDSRLAGSSGIRNVLGVSDGIGNANTERSESQSKDTEWNVLAKLSGKPIERCVLEAVLSPTESEATLIVSLRRVEIGDNPYDFHPDAGVFQTDYKVLVRDPVGKTVPLALDKKAQSWIRDRPAVRMEPITPGGAIGTSIPLARCFDIKAPGEYSVLVALSSMTGKSRLWVAEPIKIRVVAKPPASKK